LKFKKSITVLVSLIAILSITAALYGILSFEGEPFQFESIHGQTVNIYGKGLYRYESESLASQAIGQDIVTVLLGIPILMYSFCLAKKGTFKGKLLLTGTLGYFLYTYITYSFLSMYNNFFLIYVMNMAACFYAFVLSIMSIDVDKINENFSDKLPRKTIGVFLIFIAVAISLMWLKIIVTPLMNGTVPVELEHYTTLVIQALDLAFVVPTAILAGILLFRKKTFGYLLAPIIIIKAAALLMAITAMIVMQMIRGIEVDMVQVGVFLVFDLIIVVCLAMIMKNIKEPKQ
jgi:hypothetical protein